MGDYFHGWRRKVGVVTLFTACLFMAAWVRGQATSVDNQMSFTGFDKSRYILFLNPEGIDLGKLVITQDGNRQGLSIHGFLEVPHWAITIPLTLISLWLLLIKPKKSTPKKITEPITVEGT